MCLATLLHFLSLDDGMYNGGGAIVLLTSADENEEIFFRQFVITSVRIPFTRYISTDRISTKLGCSLQH